MAANDKTSNPEWARANAKHDLLMLFLADLEQMTEEVVHINEMTQIL